MVKGKERLLHRICYGTSVFHHPLHVGGYLAVSVKIKAKKSHIEQKRNQMFEGKFLTDHRQNPSKERVDGHADQRQQQKNDRNGNSASQRKTNHPAVYHAGWKQHK